MSGDVADSTNVRSALGQVETGKGLLFWGREQESTGWERVVANCRTMWFPSLLGLSPNQTEKLGLRK